MKVVVQRVASAKVVVAGEVTGQIGPGLLVLLGITHKDGEKEAAYLAEKIANLRVFQDQDGKMNSSVRDLSFEVLVVSQFTLYGNCQNGRRPDFIDAAPPDIAEPLYRKFVELLGSLVKKPIATGRFGAKMEVHLVNDGPVTLVVDSK
jgi:D-tyrosyl-tRNA(Tyr) deacylase